MLQAVVSGIVRSSANTVLGRTRVPSPEKPEHYHFVFTHSDDEIPLLPVLERIARSGHLSASFTLVTNSSQGYEPGMAASREEFAELRVLELNQSLKSLGFLVNIEAIMDERVVYEMMADEEYERIHPLMDKAKEQIRKQIKRQKPDAVFVNDFAAGHIMHDLSNFLTCIIGLELGFSPVEYWQYFGDAKNHRAVIGELGYDRQARTYDVDLPSLGIKDSTAYLSPLDIVKALRHKRKFYPSQKKTLDRLLDQHISPKLIAPEFRHIDPNTVDHTKVPFHGVLYEHMAHRQRGLRVLPGFDHYRALVQSYRQHLVSNLLL